MFAFNIKDHIIVTSLFCGPTLWMQRLHVQRAHVRQQMALGGGGHVRATWDAACRKEEGEEEAQVVV